MKTNRQKLAALRSRVKQTQSATKATQIEQKEKRARKRAPLELTPVAPRVKPVNSTNVEGWFRAGLRKLYGSSFIISNWGVRQRKLAKLLLETYGPELVEKGVVHICEHWREWVRQSKGGLSGAPTVNLLWGMRDRVFADVQNVDNEPEAGKRPENSDEYRGGSESKEAGW